MFHLCHIYSDFLFIYSFLIPTGFQFDWYENGQKKAEETAELGIDF
jgi:hypothetical protein